jgi:hypothetical protein
MPNEKQAIRNIRKVLRVSTPARHAGSVAPRPQPQSPEGRTYLSQGPEIFPPNSGGKQGNVPAKPGQTMRSGNVVTRF